MKRVTLVGLEKYWVRIFSLRFGFRELKLGKGFERTSFLKYFFFVKAHFLSVWLRNARITNARFDFRLGLFLSVSFVLLSLKKMGVSKVYFENIKYKKLKLTNLYKKTLKIKSLTFFKFYIIFIWVKVILPLILYIFFLFFFWGYCTLFFNMYIYTNIFCYPLYYILLIKILQPFNFICFLPTCH